MSIRRISWGKCGRCARLTTLPTSCAFVMKSGNLNFLETSGTLQARNGTALPLPLLLLNWIDLKLSNLWLRKLRCACILDTD